jgi:hypothetical protein
VGYNLTMTKLSAACSETAVQELIYKRLPEAVPLSCAGGEMAFQLPVANKAAFPELFQDLEEQKDALKIGGYGISMTTLEEVFIRLANEESTPVATKKINDVQSFKYNEVNVLPPSESFADGGDSQPLNPERQSRSRAFTDKDMEAGAVYPMVTKETCTLFTAWLEMFKKRVVIARRDVKVSSRKWGVLMFSSDIGYACYFQL